MAFRKTIAMLTSLPDNRGIRAGEIAKKQGIDSKQASVELNRAVKRGFAKRVSRGKYILANRERAIAYLDKNTSSKTQQTQQNPNRGGISPNPEGSFIRVHNISFNFRVLIAPSLGEGWVSKRVNSGFVKYVREGVLLGDGLRGTVVYERGIKKRSLTVNVEPVWVPVGVFYDFLDRLNKLCGGVKDVVYSDFGFTLDAVKVVIPGHFALPLDKWGGWPSDLGEIRFSDVSWIDQSLGETFPEFETVLKDKAYRFAGLPDEIDDIKSELALLRVDIVESVKVGVKVGVEEAIKLILGRVEVYTPGPDEFKDVV